MTLHMDIYGFINSMDVAEHCRDIGKTWNPFETAVIIGRSHRPMADRHGAWRWMTGNLPDTPTPANMNFKGLPSLHGVINEVIGYEESLLKLLKESDGGAVYAYGVRGCDHGSGSVFSGYEPALSHMKERYGRSEAPFVTLRKLYIDDKATVEAFLDYDGNVYSLSATGDGEFLDGLVPGADGGKRSMYEFFFNDGFYADIPLPFVKGDMLTPAESPYGNGEKAAMVLECTSREDVERLARRLRYETSDGTDMLACCLRVDGGGLLYADHDSYGDCLEYFRGELKGSDRLLHYVSLFIKGELQLPELMVMQMRMFMQNQLDGNMTTDTHGFRIPANHIPGNLHKAPPGSLYRLDTDDDGDKSDVDGDGDAESCVTEPRS